MTGQQLLTCQDLVKEFACEGSSDVISAVNGISFSIREGRTLALVGESGSGKTTTGRIILHLIEPTAGTVHFSSRNLVNMSERKFRSLRTRIQAVFQDPYDSLNPRMRVGDTVLEPLRRLGLMDGRDADQILDDLFEDVGLDRSLIRRYPHELSGGQQQKVGIARAIATGPDLVVLDEPTSSLDSVARAELIDLLRRLQQEHDVAYLFITHDLTVAQHFAHEVAVMYLGKIVEIGDARKVFRDPQHPYSQALLSAALAPEPGGRGSLITLEGEIPSPIQLPEGCHFCSRCPVSEPSCRDGFPGLESVSSGHSVACYRAGTSIRG